MKNISLTALYIAAAIASAVFIACVDDETSATGPGPSEPGISLPDPCPENLICDTTYVDKKAYSFVYYTGKKKLDTVTASVHELECDIEEDSFSCTLEEHYSSSGHSEEDWVREDYDAVDMPTIELDSDSVEHLKVNVKRIDTTYINYGKNRLMDYIPPYIETPKLNKKELQAAFASTTFEVRRSGSNEIYYLMYAEYESPYEFYDAKGLPDWFGIDADSYTESSTGCIDDPGEWHCEKIITTHYPLSTKSLRFEVYAIHSKMMNDTTVTWTAYYKDLYGVKDSVQLTTNFIRSRDY